MVSELTKREEQGSQNEPAVTHSSARHVSECPVEDWLTFLGHRWSALILWRLSDRELGFSELMQTLPKISPKVLTERLEGFAERGLVTRSSQSTFPRRTTYALTDAGREISQMLSRLYEWAR
ncbi:helix-turn-helix domain-containing protein [Agrobacterium sp.]|jgi:DNA-binding HxlR family transcriptional regulator|uniref:winged helix-turn-helix transcriptional regulator n=1 Tax=Agrobacterium sp. TaxID=361 RepID=UPI0028A59C7D|nr:helix-turn-helix domain-containing protein [Agrobacterium sp.]